MVIGLDCFIGYNEYGGINMDEYIGECELCGRTDLLTYDEELCIMVCRGCLLSEIIGGEEE